MKTLTIGSSAVQGPLWGAAAEDWAAFQERTMLPIFEAVIARIEHWDACVLDMGCGSGLFAERLIDSGMAVDGLDASDPLLAIARRVAPRARFRQGDMEMLPYDARTFDVVTAIDSLQYAADPQQALWEARRVAKPGGKIFIATWGEPERCEATAYLVALKLLPAPPNAPGPFALSNASTLRKFVEVAGLRPDEIVDLDVPFEYPNLDVALWGLLSAGPAARAIQTSGRATVTHAVAEAILPFKQRGGGYRLRNQFKLLVATRPA